MKKNELIIILLVAVIIALSFFAVLRSNLADQGELSPYSAVYLESGDIYFGKLKRFPYLQMTDVWLVQRSVDGSNNPNLSVVPFSGAFWGPADKIKINPDKVIFAARLRKNSQVAKIIENPEIINQTLPN